jgi:hypothetical protein
LRQHSCTKAKGEALSSKAQRQDTEEAKAREMPGRGRKGSVTPGLLALHRKQNMAELPWQAVENVNLVGHTRDG